MNSDLKLVSALTDQIIVNVHTAHMETQFDTTAIGWVLPEDDQRFESN